MKKYIVLAQILLLVFATGCESKEFYAFSLEDDDKETVVSFKITDKDGTPVSDAYVISFRAVPPIHVRVGEGATSSSGIIRFTDKTNTIKGYATIQAVGYNSQKVKLNLEKGVENEVLVQLAPQSALKIMSYNVFMGFQNLDESKREYIEWVKALDPDVIFYQELYRFTTASFSDFAKSYGHDYSEMLSSTVLSVGITSKKPITDVVREQPSAQLHHGYLSLITHDLHLYAIHLCPYAVDDERNKRHIDRNEEMKLIINDAKNMTAGKPTIIAGDYNSANTWDIEAWGDGFPYANRDHTVYKTCIENGFADSYPIRSNEFKSSFFVDQIAVNGTNKGTRIDYIMISKNLVSKCVFSDILQNKLTDKASDHYPTYAEIEY